jgi:alkanesulfonate monooxygenase SsuD/methylene tetrahydromethanopterin reductase-like flavin-dependent oxidoreductase (luciferase family)
MCAPTDEEARARAEGSSFFQFALGYYSTHAPGVPGEIKLWEEYLAYRETPKGQVQRVGGLIGSPATIRERLRKFEESQVDQVILLNQAGKNTHDDICSSLELFAKEVMDEFHERDSSHQEWKQRVLSGELELEELDTEPFATPRRQL